MRRMVAVCAEFNLSASFSRQTIFHVLNGKFLTHSTFASIVSRLLKDLPDSSRYTPHSFRIGGATAAAASSYPESTIQEAGRWKSSAFATYVLIPHIFSRPRNYPLSKATIFFSGWGSVGGSSEGSSCA